MYVNFYYRPDYQLKWPNTTFSYLLAKKTVVQLKNNGHKLFYRSEMEISEVHSQNFASYKQKTILACKPKSSSSLSKDMCYKKYMTKGQEDPIPLQTQSSTDS